MSDRSIPVRRPTRDDVARLAAVSVATVSYVLNDVATQRISPETQEAVRRAAAQLGYRPNPAARNLAVGKSGVVLYLVPRFGMNDQAVAVSSALGRALAERGVILSVQFESDDADDVARTIANLHPIAVTSMLPLGAAATGAIAKAGIPALHLAHEGRLFESLFGSAANLQIDHLVDRGHSRLAFAAPDDPLVRDMVEMRYEALAAGCNQRGLDLPVRHAFTVDHHEAAVVEAWRDRGITAVCGFNDATAALVLRGLRVAEIACPAEMAVVGLDATPWTYVLEPPLTSVGYHVDRLIELAVSELLDVLGHPAPEVSSGSVAYLRELEST